MGVNLSQIVNKFIKVKSVGGTGTLQAVPQGSSSGNALGTIPSTAIGARIYLASSDSVTFTIASSQPSYGTLTPIHSTASFTGPVSPVPASNVLQDGWIDLSGNVWDINSSGGLECANVGSSPWNKAMLIRPASESMVDGEITATFQYDPLKDKYLALRHNGVTGTANCYMGGLKGNGTVSFYGAVNGSMVVISGGGSVSGLTSGTNYKLTFKVIQAGASTNLTTTVTDMSGNTLATSTVNDSTSQLQGVSGRAGAFEYWNSGAVQGSDYLSLSTYALSNFNTYTISGANTPNWDELLNDNQMIYVTQTTGSPLFRWY